MQRHIFFISDGTGITAEEFGMSLMSQFDSDTFIYTTLPYVDTPEKAQKALEHIEQTYQAYGLQPIVFITLPSPHIRSIFNQSPALIIDLFSTFIPLLEKALGKNSSEKTRGVHSAQNTQRYHERIDAINYALATDDGSNTRRYDEADIILVGVSRSGKTPTSIYLALHFSIKAANYPITQEDIDSETPPKCLTPYKNKCFGLTINADRLAQIRDKRISGSSYASSHQCAKEIVEAEYIFKQLGIPYINTTSLSVEEIATKIVVEKNLGRTHH